jgi:acyl phosphate:glycerol-3-phosphate acyltransferase
VQEALAVTIAYLVGSIPFAYLLSRRRGVDLRHVGSGNVGASNVLRTSGVRAAVLAMALDGVKGALAVLLAQRLMGSAGVAAGGATVPVAAGLASVVGHVYPVWLRFRGGKGVATAAGVFAVLMPAALGVAGAVFLIAVWLTRYISVGSVAGAAALATAAAVSDAPAAVAAGAALVLVLILFRHRANVRRVIAGTERRVGQRLFNEIAG